MHFAYIIRHLVAASCSTDLLLFYISACTLFPSNVEITNNNGAPQILRLHGDLLLFRNISTIMQDG